MAEPKYRRPLNGTQLAILHELYRHRIGTTQLLASALQASATKHNDLLRERKLLPYVLMAPRLFPAALQMAHTALYPTQIYRGLITSPALSPSP